MRSRVVLQWMPFMNLVRNNKSCEFKEKLQKARNLYVHVQATAIPLSQPIKMAIGVTQNARTHGRGFRPGCLHSRELEQIK